MEVSKQMVVLTCPDCGGHDEATVDKNGEVYFTCYYCHYVGYYGEVPKENFGKKLLEFGTGNPDSDQYVMMTVRLQDGQLTYFVLSNAEITHEGKSMSDAAKAYHTQTDVIK